MCVYYICSLLRTGGACLVRGAQGDHGPLYYILYYGMLCYTIHYTILYYTILYYNALYYTILYYTIV